ncbi:MAG: hypothetical protein QOI13_2986 [Paraburkholderia sp.]|jgi:hypothetical protein|nr:hypothetical protein [Paraburkholderia sp.]
MRLAGLMDEKEQAPVGVANAGRKSINDTAAAMVALGVEFYA